MHKLESFAVSTGSKISKPFIDQCYFPVLDKKYICVSQNSISESKSYSHFSDVMFHIKPFLDENGISVLELGKSNREPIFYTKNYNNTTKLQSNYIINKSLLYFGNFNYYANVASTLNKPIVCPSNKDFKDTFAPYWSKDEASKILMPESDLLPSFQDTENPKTIDSIAPEKIGSEILDYLNISHDLNQIETIYTGPSYHTSTLDIIPSNSVINDPIHSNNIRIRMDKNFDLNFLIQCSKLKNFSIITDQAIPSQVLNHLKSNIQMIVYIVNEKTKNEEVQIIHSLGKRVELITQDSKNINKIRLNLIDYPVVLQEKNSKKDLNVKSLENLYFLSKRNVISGGKAFNSLLSLAEDKNISTVLNKKTFWEDLRYCRVYKKS